MTRKGWSISLVVLAVVALAVKFLPKLLGFQAIEPINAVLLGLAIVCLYGLREKESIRPYYHIVFIVWGILLLNTVAMNIWRAKLAVDPLWEAEGGLGAVVFKFMANSWYPLLVMGFLLLLFTLFVIIVIRERPKMNWVFIGSLAGFALELAWSYFLAYGPISFEGHMQYQKIGWIINIALTSLWMVGAVMVGVRELRKRDV